MPLSRLIYVSESNLDPAMGSNLQQLGAIMRASLRNNRAAGVTGALIFDSDWFFQALEGERETIWSTFERIRDDDRHTRCTLVEMVEVEARTFGNWWMGLATRDARTESAFRPFLRSGVLKADQMSARDILTLMSAVARIGLRREMQAAA